MPEYLSPGVYVEETSFRAKSIEGLSTTTTGFVGPTRYGPLDIEPDIVTSLVEFERTYGSREKLEFTDVGEIDNYLWHAVRAFFEEGGKRAYISRVYLAEEDDADANAGCATGIVDATASPPPAHNINVRARFPGAAGDARVSFVLKVGQNVLSQTSAGGGQPLLKVASLQDRDLVWIRDTTSPPTSPPGSGGFYLALWNAHEATWYFTGTGNEANPELELQSDLSQTDEIRIVTVSVVVEPIDTGVSPFVAGDFPLDPQHRRGGSPDSLFAYFAEDPASLNLARTLPIVVTTDATNALQVLDVFAAGYQPSAVVSPPDNGLEANLETLGSTADRLTVRVSLTGGSDGRRPGAGEYEGTASFDNPQKTGLKQFEDIDDISIVAAPGSTFGYSNSYHDDARSIMGLLIAHAQNMRYRIAVLDSGDGQSISEVRALRAQLDSSYAALYYPWIRTLDPLTRQEINLPPSGFVAGIYARNDINRAVYKAPANEVVNLALGFEQMLNKSQQDVLNPEGINCFRYFEGRGYRLWGARTVSSDPEWKYVNLRRYFAYLEHSIDKGTQWAVFEPNGEQLWANVRRTVSDFLLNEWQNGALLGDKPEKSFFVKCDRSTMSQNDLDNGRLICLIGVAPLRPAEFVIFRIGQWTSDAKV
jgi:phage tail sheath protein FI